MNELPKTAPARKTIYLKSGAKLLLLMDGEFLSSWGETTFVHFTNGGKIIAKVQASEIEAILSMEDEVGGTIPQSNQIGRYPVHFHHMPPSGEANKTYCLSHFKCQKCKQVKPSSELAEGFEITSADSPTVCQWCQAFPDTVVEDSQ